MKDIPQIKWLWVLIFSAILFFTAYGIDRVALKYFAPYSFEYYFASISFLFLIGYYLFRHKAFQWTVKELFITGLLLRLLLFFMAPNLSDDFHRFLWDGKLVQHGINPYLYLPSELYQTSIGNKIGLSEALYKGFNSQHYYSVYPPVNQCIYAIASWFGGDSVYQSALALRAFIILAEMASLFFLYRLLELWKKPIKLLLLYIFNPLILLELTGNLHSEALMMPFLLGAIYFLYKNKAGTAGVLWGLAIASKLLPLMFLPFLWKRFPLKITMTTGLMALLTFVLVFVPFWDAAIPDNIRDSLDKYFGYFEFNAGIPYLIRYIGYQFVDYSILSQVLPHAKKLLIGFILLYALFSKKKQTIVTPMLWTGLLYFLLAGILHPWYISFLIPLGILANSYWIVVWSFLIQLSYSAYSTADYHENYFLIACEFGLLLGFILFEAWYKKRERLQLISQDT